MGSTEKRGGKHSGKFPNYGDDKMVTQGFREMNLNVYDSDDWLVINKEPNFRAMNGPRVAPNPTHRAWGQPAMLGLPRPHEQVSWNNFHPPGAGYMCHPPGAGYMCRPPSMVNNSHNGVVMGNMAGQPPLRNGSGVDGRGDYKSCYDGMRTKNNGCVNPVVVSDSSDDEEEGDVSDSKVKYVTNSKAQTKGVSQGLTSDPWGNRGAVPSPFMHRVNAPSDVPRPGYVNYGWNPAGRGVMSQPAARPPPPPRSRQDYVRKGDDISKVNCNDGDFTTDYEGEFSDEDADWEREDDVMPTSWSHQSGYPVHGQVGVDPRLGMHRNVPPPRVFPSQVRPIAFGVMPPANPVHGWNVGAGGGSSPAEAARHGHKKEVHCGPSKIKGSGRNPVSGANSCKMSAKYGGRKREILPEADFSDSDDEEDSQFDDNECKELESRLAAESVKKAIERSRKAWEERCYIRQTSKFDKDEKKQCDKTQNESGDATDVCAGKLLQNETKKVADQSNANMSFFEDYKNKVKEVAKLVKSHITSRHEDDTSADVGRQLMKIQEELLEMKKRHREEERELHKQYNAALKRFMEKQTAADCDSVHSDASDEL